MPFHLTDFVRHPPQDHTDPILSGTTCFVTGPITHSALIAYATSHLHRLENPASYKYEVLYITCDRDAAREELAEWDTEACLGDDSWRTRRPLMCRIRICYTPTLQHLFALLATFHLKTHSDNSFPILTSQSISLILVEDLPKIIASSLNVATLARTLALLTDAAQHQICDLLITTRMLADEFETLQIPFAQFSNATVSIKDVVEKWCEWVVKVFHRKGNDKKQIISVSAISSLKFHHSSSVEPITRVEPPLEYHTDEDRHNLENFLDWQM